MSGGFVEVIAEVGPTNRAIDNSDLHLEAGTYFPTMADAYLKGGFRVLSTTAQRDAIPATAKKIGMVVYVPGTGYFEWDGGSWIVWAPGSSAFPFTAIAQNAGGTYLLPDGPTNYDLLIDTTTSAPGGITYQLPVNPVSGQRVRVRDYSGAAAPVGTFINIDASLSAGNIVAPGFPGGTASISVISAYGWVEVVWESVSGLWYQVGESGSSGGAISPGTADRLTKYDATGTDVEDSSLAQDGSGNIQFAADNNLLPDAAGSCEVGTDALPFRRIRALEVVSGDHVFDNPGIGVTLRVLEDRKHLLIARDERTGRYYKFNLTEISHEDTDHVPFSEP